MLEIILAIGGNDLRYKWLITDITAYPQDNGQYDHLIENNNYLSCYKEAMRIYELM